MEVIRLARDDSGEGEPVLLVHGFPTSRGLWHGLTPHLVSAGFRVVAPDLAGYGDSPGAPDVGMENQAVWLLGLLDEIELRQVTLIAHDVGTAAAQILTVRSPERVRELVLMDGVYETEWAMSTIDRIRSWNPDDSARLHPVLARKLRSIRGLLEAYAGEEGGKRLIHAARCLEPRQTAGITARLRATGVPVRLIWGSDDAFLPVESVAKPLAAALDAPLETISGSHFLPLENPAAVADALLRGRTTGTG
jgi:2-hydroxymuconate-semialdehyde hydrolase